jgi:hypothetical protein
MKLEGRARSRDAGVVAMRGELKNRRRDAGATKIYVRIHRKVG